MEKKHQVHNLIILDESGSMDSIKETTIQGFNSLVKMVKSLEKEFHEQEYYISLISFNGKGRKLLHFIDPVSQLSEINSHIYLPDASTPLYDAMGFSIHKLQQVLQNQTDYNVLVTILTDGEENSSVNYKLPAIKRLISKQTENNWTFTYIGTDHDVAKSAQDLSIENTLQFQKNDAAMKEMFDIEMKSRIKYSQKIKDKLDTKGGFYKD